ncbi:hypothetical protein [Luethyella okanaganae]|uniref:Uncharacterized protein n=1 Tax=Luethyella okanaganae TaxID=69372 RepID=A0ABW1VD29_9MICO
MHRTQSCWQELDTGKSLCVDANANLANAVFEKYGIELSTSDGALAVGGGFTSARSTVMPVRR